MSQNFGNVILSATVDALNRFPKKTLLKRSNFSMKNKERMSHLLSALLSKLALRASKNSAGVLTRRLRSSNGNSQKLSLVPVLRSNSRNTKAFYAHSV